MIAFILYIHILSWGHWNEYFWRIYGGIFTDISFFWHLCLPWSFINNSIKTEFDILYYFYIYRVYNVLTGIVFADNYIVIIMYAGLLCYNMFATCFIWRSILAYLNEWIIYIYQRCIQDQVNGMNITNNCVIIFLYNRYGIAWWFIM